MTLEEFLKDYAPYQDEWGLVHPRPNSISENGLRFTAEKQIAAQVHKLDQSHLLPFVPFLKCVVEPGLYKRHPEDYPERQIGHDDYIGVGAWESLHENRGGAKEIINYGRSHFYSFNNVNPGKWTTDSFLGRHWQDFAAIKHVAGYKLNLFDKLWLKFAFDRAAKGDKMNQDNWCLTAMIAFMLRDIPDGMVRNARGRFILAFKKAWPHGYGECLASYFSGTDPNGANHPSVKYLWDFFGE